MDHVVRMQTPPDVVAFVLTGPIAGRGTPEQVYFAPKDGVEALFDALKAAAPPTVTVDTGTDRREVPETAPST